MNWTNPRWTYKNQWASSSGEKRHSSNEFMSYIIVFVFVLSETTTESTTLATTSVLPGNNAAGDERLKNKINILPQPPISIQRAFT